MELLLKHTKFKRVTYRNATYQLICYNYAATATAKWIDFLSLWNEKYDDGMLMGNIMDCGHHDANNDWQTWSLLLSNYYNKQLSRYMEWPTKRWRIHFFFFFWRSSIILVDELFVFFFIVSGNYSLDPHQFRFRNGNDTSIKLFLVELIVAQKQHITQTIFDRSMCTLIYSVNSSNSSIERTNNLGTIWVRNR